MRIADNCIDFSKALQLNPHDVSTILVYGATLSGEGNAQEGLRWIDKALEMDPHVSDFAWKSKAECLYMLREYEASLDIMMSWRAPPPHTYSQMAACYRPPGAYGRAISSGCPVQITVCRRRELPALRRQPCRYMQTPGR